MNEDPVIPPALENLFRELWADLLRVSQLQQQIASTQSVHGVLLTALLATKGDGAQLHRAIRRLLAVEQRSMPPAAAEELATKLQPYLDALEDPETPG